jgi:pimeloyl-ACP methyl ester carboxylesterase
MTNNSTTRRGFRALAGAQRELPEARVATLAAGEVQYIAAGKGSPAVVLLSSFGVPFQTWALVWRELAASTTSFAYNRLGVGASAPPQQPQTGTAVVDMVREALSSAGLEPPYVLVAHGLGGLYAQLYARRFPQELVGLVLVESTHPDDDVLERRLRFLPRGWATILTAGAVRRGVRRHSELRFHEHTRAEIRAAGPFPDIPLAVVTGERPSSRLTTSPTVAQRHDRRQRDLVVMSPQGLQFLAPKSGHFPQITDPEVVVMATRHILAQPPRR